MASAVWNVDASHTLLEFAVKHMMIATVKGRFTSVEGQVTGDPADLTTAQFVVSAGVSSVNTGEAQRDDHLRSPTSLTLRTTRK